MKGRSKSRLKSGSISMKSVGVKAAHFVGIPPLAADTAEQRGSRGDLSCAPAPQDRRA